MKYNPAIHHRRSIRLQGYDYSQAGAYFVTVCTQNREYLLGDIVGGEMRLNDAGEMIGGWYSELENKFPEIECDEFVCMPNHIHFIAVNVAVTVGADLCVRPDDPVRVRNDPTRVCPVDSVGNVHHDSPHGQTQGQTRRSAPTTATTMAATTAMGEHIGSPLHRVVQWFKTMTTNGYIHGVKQNGWPQFPGKLWQRNYCRPR
jgi:putative transposase